MRTKRIVNITAVFIIAIAVITAVFQITSPASAADEAVEVWLTLADESKLLTQEADLQFQAGAGVDPETIIVDESQLYQQFEGVGAAMTDSSAWLIMNAISETERNALMADLFSDSGINLSYVRVPMGASDFALSSYTYDDMPPGESDPTLANFSIVHDEDYIIPSLQQAKALNPQLRLMGTPWSAPAWMKDNDNLNTGALQSQYYEAFADYHVKFAEAYAAHGLPIDSLTPQNEPKHETPNYPSMGMTAEEQKIFVRDHLGPAIEDANLQTRLLLLDHNWDLAAYPASILADPAAYAYADGTAFHCYAGDVEAQTAVHNAYPDKGIWFTECSGGGWSTDFSDNMTWNMQNLVIGNFRNYGKSLLLWNLALDENDGPQNGGCSDCRGVVTINQATQAIDYNVEYYVLGHVSKFVDPGAYRIDSTPFMADGPENVAFHNPDGSIVLIVHAEEAADFDVSWQGQHFSYSLPAQGTVTFQWDGDSVPATDNVLQGFEAEGTYYDVWNSTNSLSNTARFGTYSLQMVGGVDPWHTVAAELNNSPVDATGFSEICFWVLDTGQNDEGIAFKLVDTSNASKEIWSSDLSTPVNTVQNEWVQMCFDVSAFTEIDLSAIDHVEFTTYNGTPYLYDQVTYTIPEVEIEKMVALSNSPVQPGDMITYTVSVLNAGTAVAENVHITDTLPTYVSGVNLDVTQTISAGESISFTIPATVARNAPWDSTITNSAYYSYTGGNNSDSISFTVAELPLGMLQEFEEESAYYPVYNVTPTLSSLAYAGLSSLQTEGDGEWHTTGVNLYNSPVDTTVYRQLCIQVRDSGGGGNTIGLKLIDGTGTNQEFWSDVFGNSTTVSNEWVEMCFDVAAYTDVDLTDIATVELTTYWGDPYNFDNLRGTLPQLNIRKSVEATAIPKPGELITYTVIVENEGTAVAETVHITDMLPAEVTGIDLDVTQTISVGKSITLTIPATINNDARGVAITNTAYFSHSSGQGSDDAVFTTAYAPSNIIQDFELLPNVTYEAYNATVGLTETIVHSGDKAMFMVGDGAWHRGGVYPYNAPRDLSASNYLCYWVYDGFADNPSNTMSLILIDETGASQETWSDAPANADNPNPKTIQYVWTPMCYSLSAYDLVDLTQIASIEFNTYWGGPYYFDDVTLNQSPIEWYWEPTYLPLVFK